LISSFEDIENGEIKKQKKRICTKRGEKRKRIFSPNLKKNSFFVPGESKER